MKLNHKIQFRKLCIERLEFTSKRYRYYKSKVLVRNLEKIILETKAKNILLYVPLYMEVDVRPLINKLRRYKNKKVFVPYMKDDSFKAVKYRLPLKKKKFGIKEPNNSFCRVKGIDLAVVPIVGVDSLYKRIGFGRGMYDRFSYNLNYKPIIIFTQLSLCKSDKILSNDYDIQADYIITN